MIIPWVVTTSDAYLHLMPEFAIRFNEFIGTYKVDVLCFERPERLPDNFNVISLGKQQDYGKVYTDPLIPYFNNLAKENEFFFYLLEDYYISRPMKHESLKEAFKYCKENNLTIDKIDLSENISRHPHEVIQGTGILKANNFARMKCSFQAACWRTEYFIKLLTPNLTIWNCEKVASNKAKGDNANIFGFTEDLIPLEYYNEYYKGELRKIGRRKQSRQKRYRLKMTKSLIKHILKTRKPKEQLNCMIGNGLYKVNTKFYNIDITTLT